MSIIQGAASEYHLILFLIKDGAFAKWISIIEISKEIPVIFFWIDKIFYSYYKE
jgi:hypothetical protein